MFSMSVEFINSKYTGKNNRGDFTHIITPWRLMGALISSAHLSTDNPEKYRAVLQQLCEEAPEVFFPLTYGVEGQRSYARSNEDVAGKFTKEDISRTSKAVYHAGQASVYDPVYFVWSDLKLSGKDMETLSSLCRKVTCVGLSGDFARVEACDTFDLPDYSYSRYVPCEFGTLTMRSLTPDTIDVFDSLYEKNFKGAASARRPTEVSYISSSFSLDKPLSTLEFVKPMSLEEAVHIVSDMPGSFPLVDVFGPYSKGKVHGVGLYDFPEKGLEKVELFSTKAPSKYCTQASSWEGKGKVFTSVVPFAGHPSEEISRLTILSDLAGVKNIALRENRTARIGEINQRVWDVSIEFEEEVSGPVLVGSAVLIASGEELS